MAKPARATRLLAVFLSVGLHALVIAGLMGWSNGIKSEQSGGGIAVDTVVFDDEIRLTLIDSGVVRKRSAASPEIAAAPSKLAGQKAEPPILDVGPITVAGDKPKGQGEEAEPVSGAGASPQGPPGNTSNRVGGEPPSFFRARAQGQRVVYVIDRSLSMGLSGALGTAKREVIRSIESLPATMRFQVIFYNRRAEPLRLNGLTELAAADTSAKWQAVELIESLRAEGATDHLPALRRALFLRPDTIFFLTDADDLTVEQVRTVTGYNQGRCVIHAIQLGRAALRGDGQLALLARANAGTFRIVEP